MAIARIAIEDKLLPIFAIGLRVLELAMRPPICGPSINPKVVNKEAS
jgi:hypothetical protein